MEPRYDEGPKNWQNLFTITNISRFFFIYFTINYGGKKKKKKIIHYTGRD